MRDDRGGRCWLLIAAISLGCATTGAATTAPTRERGTLTLRLRRRLDEGLRDDVGRAVLAGEAARLPDGTLFVRVLPALAYANLALTGGIPADE
ncbi:MAG: hypothetical protein Q8M65_00640, partial [Rhodoglobus sp.]|nr:hypothetical protein [Rhodoglobus sp.]